MECEYCAADGIDNEASAKCAECGDWVCDQHTHFRPDSTPLCQSCWQDEEELASREELAEEETDSV